MNKRIIVIFACLLLLLIPIVLLSAVFVVRDIDVVSIADSGDDFVFDADKLIADSLIPYGSSIFALSESSARHNIELKNPEIEVVNIERIFPNVVVVNINKRIPIIAISITHTSKFALLDRTLRVVNIVDDITGYNVVDYTQCMVDIREGTDINSTIIDLGDYIDVRLITLSSIIKGLESSGITKDMIPSTIKSISIVDDQSVSMKTNLGANIEVFIKPSGASVDEMVRAGLAVFVNDKKNNSPNTSFGTYYFDTTLGAWSHRA